MRWEFLALFLFLAAAADALSVRWHVAREKRDVGVMIALSMMLETLTWVPIWFALTYADWRIAAVSIVGSGAGTALGMLRRTNA